MKKISLKSDAIKYRLTLNKLRILGLTSTTVTHYIYIFDTLIKRI